MAEEYKAEGGDHEVEVKERGLFDHFNKKEEEKSHEEVLVTGVEKVHIEDVEEKKDEEKKENLLHKLHRSSSSSSSSSDEEEEVEVDGVLVKQKKKKGLKGKIKEKLGGHKKEEEEVKQEVAAATVITDSYGDTEVQVEKIDEKLQVEETQEEKKGFLDKIKEKLPGNKKPADEAIPVPAAVEVCSEGDHGHDGKEKKGILGKIMEKLPGYHKEEKESEKTTTPTSH